MVSVGSVLLVAAVCPVLAVLGHVVNQPPLHVVGVTATCYYVLGVIGAFSGLGLPTALVVCVLTYVVGVDVSGLVIGVEFAGRLRPRRGRVGSALVPVRTVAVGPCR